MITLFSPSFYHMKLKSKSKFDRYPILTRSESILSFRFSRWFYHWWTNIFFQNWNIFFFNHGNDDDDKTCICSSLILLSVLSLKFVINLHSCNESIIENEQKISFFSYSCIRRSFFSSFWSSFVFFFSIETNTSRSDFIFNAGQTGVLFVLAFHFVLSLVFGEIGLPCFSLFNFAHNSSPFSIR